MEAAEIIDFLDDEGILELDVHFPDDGDLFAAGLDSMAVMQLVVAVEEKYGAILEPADLTKENLSTPQKLTELIEAKLK